MAHLWKTITLAALALLLWLSRQPALRGTGVGALAVIGAITWVAYTLTRGLRMLWLPSFELREPGLRREVVWLVLANALLAAGLLEESARLADGFWWRCALLPALVSLALGLRLLLVHPLHRSPWAGHAGDPGSPDASFPYLRVTATATHTPSASAPGSVSIRF